MAQALTISNTAGTVDLMSGANQYATGYFCDYQAIAGSDLSPNATVTETPRLYVTGTSKADLSSKITTLQRILYQAKQWQATKAGPRTFLNWTTDGYASSRRSELVEGEYSVTPDTWGSAYMGANRAGLDLTLTRRNWWEGAEGTLITTQNVTAAPVGTASAAAPGDFFDINYGSVLGDLPAATRIQYYLSSAPLPNPGFMMVASYTYNQQSTINVPINHYENVMQAGTIWGTVGYAPSSLGQYASGTLAGSTYLTFHGGTSTLNPHAALSTYMAQFSDIGQYKIVAYLGSAGTATIKITPWISETADANYYYGNAQYVSFPNQSIIDFGLIQFPANPANVFTYSSISAGILVGAAGTFTFDYAKIMRCDAFRYYGGSFSATRTYVTDDNLDGSAVYAGTASTTRVLDITARGDPIYLMPGMWNRLYLSSWGTSVDTGHNTVMQVSVYYRPRYLLL